MNRAERRRAARLHSVPTHRLGAQLRGYDELQVVLANPDVSPEDVEDEIARRRMEYASAETVERPARTGDRVVLQIEGSVNGEPSEDYSAPTHFCELGQGSISPEFDHHIEGRSPGDETTFSLTTENGSVISFAVVVKEVQERRPADLPDCYFQAEAFIGDVILKLSASNLYGSRLLGPAVNGGSKPCETTTTAAPTITTTVPATDHDTGFIPATTTTTAAPELASAQELAHTGLSWWMLAKEVAIGAGLILIGLVLLTIVGVALTDSSRRA